MKSLIIYLIGTVLLFPCIFICSDSIVGMILGMSWGVLMWHSPKFSPTIRKFWLEFYKVHFKLLYFLQ